MNHLYILIFIILLISCNNKYEYQSSPLTESVAVKTGGFSSQYSSNDVMQNDNNKSIPSNNENSIYNQVLTYYYYYEAYSDNFEFTFDEIIKLVKIQNGFIQNQNNNYINIKIPTKNLKLFENEIDNKLYIKTKNVSANDITMQYYDSKLRLDNMLKTRERYLELLSQAENVETTLKVERELERLLYEIESLKSAINLMNNQIEFTSISVHLFEKKKPGPIGWVFYGLYKGVKWLFIWD